MSLQNDLQRLFRERLQVEAEDRNLDLMESGIIDSLALITLILALEEEFNVEISLEDTDLQRFRSLDQLEMLVLELQDRPVNGQNREAINGNSTG